MPSQHEHNPPNSCLMTSLTLHNSALYSSSDKISYQNMTLSHQTTATVLQYENIIPMHVSMIHTITYSTVIYRCTDNHIGLNIGHRYGNFYQYQYRYRTVGGLISLLIFIQ